MQHRTPLIFVPFKVRTISQNLSMPGGEEGYKSKLRGGMFIGSLPSFIPNPRMTCWLSEFEKVAGERSMAEGC